MSKVQKTFYLNAELDTFVSRISESTGASFTKIVTAALIEHLLGGLGPPHPRWMRHAAALEQREAGLAEILLRIADEDVQKAKKRLDDAETRVFNKAVNNTHLAHCDEAYGMSRGYAQALRKDADQRDDPFAWLIDRWISMLENRVPR